MYHFVDRLSKATPVYVSAHLKPPWARRHSFAAPLKSSRGREEVSWSPMPSSRPTCQIGFRLHESLRLCHRRAAALPLLHGFRTWDCDYALIKDQKDFFWVFSSPLCILTCSLSSPYNTKSSLRRTTIPFRFMGKVLFRAHHSMFISFSQKIEIHYIFIIL